MSNLLLMRERSRFLNYQIPFSTATVGIGYAMAGYGPPNSQNIDDLNFALETSDLLSAQLTTASADPFGFNSDTKGYASGGDGAGQLIQSLLFSNESTNVETETLNRGTRFACGLNNITNGFQLGGSTSGVASGTYNYISKYTFSSETIADLSATLNTAKMPPCGGGYSDKGFCLGGHTANDVQTNVIEDLIYSNETSSAISATLGSNIGYQCGVNSSSAVYSIGSQYYSGSWYWGTVVYKLLFSNETTSTLSATLSVGTSTLCGVNSNTCSYQLGGSTSSSRLDTIQKLPFSTETFSTLSATLNAVVARAAGVQTDLHLGVY